MAILDSKAIVISSLKYGDSSLIVRLYTEEAGLVSFMIRGVLKSKKGKIRTSYFQVLTQLKVSFNHNQKQTLHSLKEAQVIHPYENIPFNIVKQSIVLFLSEILSSSVQEEEVNKGLYTYLEYALIWLDTHESITNFHLLFILNLTKYLGFYPETKDNNLTYFDLREGNFTESSFHKECISGQKLAAFKKLLAINFDAIENVSFSKSERQMVLQVLMQYFELHLQGFRKPKSLSVLETIFR